MGRQTWSVQDAKNRFSEVVEAARRKPQTVTKHGKPAVVDRGRRRVRALAQTRTSQGADLCRASARHADRG